MGGCRVNSITYVFKNHISAALSRRMQQENAGQEECRRELAASMGYP